MYVLPCGVHVLGDATDPNSESVTASGTAFFLNSFVKLCVAKYLATLSDYIGRKPLIVIGLSMQSVAFLLFYGAQDIPTVYLSAMLRGGGDVFLSIGGAWLNDSVQFNERGLAFAMLYGACTCTHTHSTTSAVPPSPAHH